MASFTRPPTPARLVPLLAQYEHASARLLDRMAGPVRDSGNGQEIGNAPMTDAEYFREPVPGCWSVRRRPDGRWGRDTAPAPHPVPPPFTTLAWRLSHLTEMLALRSDHTDGTRSLVREEFDPAGDAESAVASYAKAATAWRSTLLRVDDAALDTVGYSRYPYGSDAEDLFLEIVWWVNQEVLHHGAEIALLRDLYASHPDR
ncbi:DinB family protein [Streptomyces sp. NPDC048603]|uniref:DinB family protein n=1 Tax=Streptomyces sp. NPDC048603 TaxID=3365577 RepID=UPI00370FC390